MMVAESKFPKSNPGFAEVLGSKRRHLGLYDLQIRLGLRSADVFDQQDPWCFGGCRPESRVG